MPGAVPRIPIIDLSDISLSNETITNGVFDEIGKELHSAFSTYGFAYLSNHGIPTEVIEDCMQSAQTFFDISTEDKLKYSRGVNNIHGYSHMSREVLHRDEVERKESFDIVSLSSSALYPDIEAPNLRPHATTLANLAVKLARSLLRSLACDLGTQTDSFLDNHSGIFTPDNRNATCLRLLHYPAASPSNGQGSTVTRCARHTDYGGMTFVFQDNLGGLEIQTLGGEWIPATPIAGTIVVNIGDLLSFWSGGRYRATPHRVQYSADTSTKSRNSIALFVHPDSDVVICPMDGKHDKKECSCHTAKEWVEKRFSDTYSK